MAQLARYDQTISAANSKSIAKHYLRITCYDSYPAVNISISTRKLRNAKTARSGSLSPRQARSLAVELVKMADLAEKGKT